MDEKTVNGDPDSARSVAPWSWARNRFGRLLFLLGASCFVLGILGFRELYPRPEFGLLDWAYRSARMFSLNYDHDGSPPLYLDVARWLAPLSIAAGFLRLFSAWLGRWWTRSRIRRLKGHILVCGLGARGAWILRRLQKESDRKLVAVEINPDQDSVAELRAHGALILEGNALDLVTLREAGIERAQCVVSVAGRDSTNLAIAREITTHFPRGPEIIAAVEDYEARSYFSTCFPRGKVRLMGFRNQASLWLSRELTCRMVEKLGPMPTRAPVVALEASDALREELVRAVAMVLQISASRRPVLYLCNADPEDAAIFNDRFPAARMVVDLHWRKESAEQAFPAGAGDGPDLVLFALETETASLASADRFLVRRELEPWQVVACLQDTGDLFEMARARTGASTSRSPTVSSLFKLESVDGHPLDPAMETEGRALHEEYARKYGGPAWLELDEFRRDSNRQSAFHESIKQAAWRIRGSVAEAALLRHLAECEHMRWMAFHAMEGWRFGEVRNNAAKIHNLLRPYPELSPDDQGKDMEVVRRSLGLPRAN